MRSEIIPLTTLRGIAAMAVIAMHFSATMQQIAASNFPSLAPHGSLAVDVFFVLSGFIMGYTYLESFRNLSGWQAYRNFLGKRAARILPLNAAITVALIFVSAVSMWLFSYDAVPTVRLDHAFADALANVLLLPGLGIGHSLNWPAWSISVEFAAYFLFSLLLALIFNPRKSILVLTCLVAVAGIYMSVWPGLAIKGMHNHPWPWRDLLRCVCEFALGLATYRAFDSGRFVKIFSRNATAVVISAAIWFIVLFNLGEFFAMLLFPALVLSLGLNSGWVANFLSLRPLHFLGKISFSLYLVTDPFRKPAQDLVQYFHPELLPPLLAMAIAAFCSLCMIVPAYITYTIVEKPGRTALRKLLSGRTKVAEVPIAQGG